MNLTTDDWALLWRRGLLYWSDLAPEVLEIPPEGLGFRDSEVSGLGGCNPMLETPPGLHPGQTAPPITDTLIEP
jgi:hypothetical protein